MTRSVKIRDLMNRDHPLTIFSDHALFSGAIFVISIVVATLVIHLSENWNLVKSFYYIAMVTTTNGAPFPPTSSAVEVFTSIWAYFSMILLATTLSVSFGPLIGYMVKEGTLFMKHAEERVEEFRK